jgi:hypothetical protein
LNSVFRFKILGNSCKLQKLIINYIDIIKMKNKFDWNNCEHISAVGLTKFHFVHYCIVENYKNLNLGVFNYKNP